MLHRGVIQRHSSVVPLSEAAEFLDHLRKPVTRSDRTEGMFPYYGANGQQGTIGDFIFDEPLVLLAEDGGHFGVPGKQVAYSVSGKTWVNNHAHVLRPKPNVDLGFLCRQLEEYDVSPFVTGTTRGKLTKAKAAAIPIWLPPPDEQKRIAGILDKADAIRRKRQQAIALTEDLPLAVYGECFGSPVANEKGWLTSTVGEEADISSGATPSKQEPSFWDGAIPWVSPKDMKRPYIDDSQDHVSEAAVDHGRVQVMSAGAVLIVVRGMILVHTMPVALSQAPLTINQDLKALRPSGRVLPEFLLWTLRTMSGYLLARVSTAAHGTKRLELDVLRKAPLITPPLELQERFCRSIKAARALEARLRAADDLPLFESLTQRAFRGEL